MALAVASALGLLTACGAEKSAPGPTVAATQQIAPDANSAAPRDASPMPAAGGVRFRIDDGGLTLQANAAPRRDLLEMLARRLGFELIAPDVGSEPVSVSAEQAALHDILPQLLPDRAYRVDYRYDPARARHVLARLEVSRLGGLATAPPVRDAEGGDAPSSASGSLAPEHRVIAQIQPSPPDQDPERVDWKALLTRLDDADAEERMEALGAIDPDGEGLPLIADRLARDPDPRVRVVAAERLEFADSLAAVDALLLGLNDPDKRVVLAAIDALEFTDDATVVEDLAPLLQHPDAEIREAAEEAIDFIDDEGGEKGEEEDE
jgi:hypothetical protein